MLPARFTLSWALLPAVLLSLTSAMPMESDAQAKVTTVSTDLFPRKFKVARHPDTNLENPGAGNLITEGVMTSAIKDFQSFAQIYVAGVMELKSEQTKEGMGLPRCGVRDKVGTSTNARERRAAASDNTRLRWKLKAFTYMILSYPSNVSSTLMTRAEVDAEIARAFEVWSNYTDLTFTAISSGEADINMSFVQVKHRPRVPSNEHYDTVAYTTTLLLGSFVRFNDAKNWTLKSDSGTNLFQIAAHEIGHTLGLDHCNFSDSVMYYEFLEYKPSFSLHAKDVEAIQCLYGKRTSENKPNEPSTVPESWEAGCGLGFMWNDALMLKILDSLRNDTHIQKIEPISKCA